MPKPKWKLEKPKTVRFNLIPEKHKRFKALLISKGRTMQEDYEDHVNQSLEK